MTLAEADAVTEGDELKRLVRAGLLQTTFRQVVDLENDRVVGYEAQQAAEQSFLTSPRQIRAALRASELVGDLDSAARFFALEAATNFGLLPETRVFVDSEPESFAMLEDRSSFSDRSVVLQLHAGILERKPAQLLRAIHQARSLGWGIAVKGVGVDMASAAHLPLVDPAVIGLDRSVLRTASRRHAADIMNVVTAHVERTGAAILVDGIDTSEDVEFAKSLGAHLGRGSYFAPRTSKPTVPEGNPYPDILLRHGSRNAGPQLSPYTLAVASVVPKRAKKEFLVEISKSLEARALASGPATIFVAAVESKDNLTPATLERFRALTDNASMVVMLASGLNESPIPGARSAPLDTSDPVRNEWTIVVLGPDWSTLLTAQDLGDGGADLERRFDFVLTHDRTLAVDAARSLMSRIPNESGPSHIAG
ncbi:EAL domain-containing protein [Spelaeicoccus albus]|uniref:EAL domain-containing protein (Putative c-di-GMP-specific phosphodiesterase class I) n=1 Tax=Spelaeicoccus albus TaxID=1280376 RepID=A0A7Z0II56_9MICO|nr:EAL domain-containing protein [Spelaeicoccus albus]NYI68223.1 EAL domain-containing protein (putative c-di-GMP-specific phosphodiesterase class I) [Spelaeicoccus albus]